MGDTPPTKPPTARGRLGELFAKVDAFFDRAAARFPGPTGITCRAGCADCCRRFSVTALEAEVIAEGLASLPAEARDVLSARAKGGDPGVCPALEGDGRCAIYAFRPVICRTHGLPIRFASRAARSLPLVDACPRNFHGRDLGSLPSGTVLDQTTLSTVLGALDAAHAEETGCPRGTRREIAALLAGATKR
jgi:Fe-S-cluster containining protein